MLPKEYQPIVDSLVKAELNKATAETKNTDQGSKKPFESTSPFGTIDRNTALPPLRSPDVNPPPYPNDQLQAKQSVLPEAANWQPRRRASAAVEQSEAASDTWKYGKNLARPQPQSSPRIKARPLMSSSAADFEANHSTSDMLVIPGQVMDAQPSSPRMDRGGRRPSTAKMRRQTSHVEETAWAESHHDGLVIEERVD